MSGPISVVGTVMLVSVIAGAHTIVVGTVMLVAAGGASHIAGTAAFSRRAVMLFGTMAVAASAIITSATALLRHGCGRHQGSTDKY